jgi:iron(III) transport system permease protein
MLFVLILGYLFIWPFAMLIAGAFRPSPFGGQTGWQLDGFVTVFHNPATYSQLASALFYSATVMVLAMLLGVIFATIAARLQVRTRLWITPCMILIAATPRLFYAVSWGMMGNPRSGLLAQALLWGGYRAPAWLTVYSWPGLILVTALKVTAVAYLLLSGPVARMDRSLEDAAVMSGDSRLAAFVKVTLPVLSPALIAVGMLLLIEGVQVFDFPALLGSASGIDTLSTGVNAYISKEMEPDWSAASALSLLTVVMIAGLLLVQARMTGGRNFSTVGGKSRQASRANLGRVGLLVDAWVVLFIIVALVMPVVQMLLGSFQPFFGLYRSMTASHYVAILSDPLQMQILLTTLLVAVVGGFLVVTLSFLMVFVMQRARGKALPAFVRIVSWLPATAPGIVLSLAFVWAYLSTPLIRNLYGTPWLMLIALVVAHVPIAARACEGIIVQVGTELEEAAMVAGASLPAAALEVTARLCMPSLLGAWLLVAVAISGALDVPLLLQTTTNQTVATYAYSLFSNGNIAEAAAFYCTFLAMLLGCAGLLFAAGTGLVRWRSRSAGVSRNRGSLSAAKGLHNVHA